MSTRPDTWMPLYVGDYLRKTMHLTLDQHGAYLLLIMACWSNDGSLPDDDEQLAAIVSASGVQWRKIRTRIAPFFEIGNGEWRNKRVTQELAKAVDVTNKRRTAGLASAAAKRQQIGNTCSTHVDDVSEQSPRPSQSQSQKEDSDTDVSGGRSPPFDPVKDLWDRGIAILGEKQRSLLGKFVKSYGKVAVLAAIVECENEMPVDPAAYFIACLERGKEDARNGSAARAAAKLAAWARAEDEPESFRGYSEAAH